jgi:hypothetical protein
LKFFKRLLNKIKLDNDANQYDDDSDAIFSLTSASISMEEMDPFLKAPSKTVRIY